jgi:N-acetylglucosamine kinase-like BadF-type ATPase
MLGLGLDAGGSATRWALTHPDGTLVARGTLPPISGHLFNEADRRKLESVAATLRDAIGPHRPTSIAAGITGLSAGTPEAAIAIEILGTTLIVEPDQIAVGNDMWIAYHAVFAPGEGHVVYAGTGSIAIHLRPDGSAVMVGGHGMLIDDAGSAFWIGRQALKCVLRRMDDHLDQSASALAQALFTAIGSKAWPDIRSYVYAANGRGNVAQLARAVAQADDADARDIFMQAGAELARLGRVLVTRIGPRPIALLGRAASLHPAILAGFRAAEPNLDAHLENPDAALAAARLAARGIMQAV